MRLTGFLLGAALLLACPAAARAQAYVAPYIAGNFGGAAGDAVVPSDTREASAWTIGGTGGWMMGWLGVEADVSYAHRFFDHDRGFVTNSSLLTAMGNGRVSLPWVATATSVQPYASAGVGVIRPSIAEAGGLAKTNEAKFGWNAGAGVTGFFTEHAGLQGDIRYFRARDKGGSTNPFGIDFDGLDFWRASVGVAFKW
jgi:opacity protein-like surface antigen